MGILFASLSSLQILRNPLKKPILKKPKIKIDTSREELTRTIILFGVKKLTPKQKELLTYIYKIGQAKTLTYLARKYSEETGLSYSTVKWNLRELRDLNLITGGDVNNKGEPVRLTEAGLLLVDYLRKNHF